MALVALGVAVFYGVTRQASAPPPAAKSAPAAPAATVTPVARRAPAKPEPLVIRRLDPPPDPGLHAPRSLTRPRLMPIHNEAVAPPVDRTLNPGASTGAGLSESAIQQIESETGISADEIHQAFEQ